MSHQIEFRLPQISHLLCWVNDRLKFTVGWMLYSAHALIRTPFQGLCFSQSLVAAEWMWTPRVPPARSLPHTSAQHLTSCPGSLYTRSWEKKVLVQPHCWPKITSGASFSSSRNSNCPHHNAFLGNICVASHWTESHSRLAGNRSTWCVRRGRGKWAYVA